MGKLGNMTCKDFFEKGFLTKMSKNLHKLCTYNYNIYAYNTYIYMTYV